MLGFAFVVPWLAPVSALWAMLPLVYPRRRRAGVIIAISHLIVTLAITRPWTEDWYWRDGAWLILVFGQGTLIALGRLTFELSPLGARRGRAIRWPSNRDPVVAQPLQRL
ncbi:hypothetical protein [Streptomyces sp. NPDC055036]